jgi:hypothetical protein
MLKVSGEPPTERFKRRAKGDEESIGSFGFYDAGDGAVTCVVSKERWKNQVGDQRGTFGEDAF